MRTIHFKNGETKEITKEVAKAIHGLLTKQGGSAPWQCFVEEDQVFLMINLNEVNYID
jgi:hypothetical protein